MLICFPLTGSCWSQPCNRQYQGQKASVRPDPPAAEGEKPLKPVKYSLCPQSLPGGEVSTSLTLVPTSGGGWRGLPTGPPGMITWTLAGFKTSGSFRGKRSLLQSRKDKAGTRKRTRKGRFAWEPRLWQRSSGAALPEEKWEHRQMKRAVCAPSSRSTKQHLYR